MAAPTWTWGPSVRKARTDAGLTQMQLAAAASCSQTTVSEIEAGEHRPSDALKVRLADALGVHPHDLFPLAPPQAELAS